MNDADNGVRTLKVGDSIVGKIYMTLRGLKIEILKKRDDGSVTIRSLASGGHELILDGEVEVLDDPSDATIVVPPDEIVTAENRLYSLMYRLTSESQASVSEIADKTQLDSKVIEKELTGIVVKAQGAMNG